MLWADVRAGAHNETFVEFGEVRLNSTRSLTHENFNSQTLDNDVALAFLDEPLNFTSIILLQTISDKSIIYLSCSSSTCHVLGFIQPVALAPIAFRPVDGQMMTAVGWGKDVGDDPSRPDTLQ